MKTTMMKTTMMKTTMMKTTMIAIIAAGGFAVASGAVASADAQVEGNYATMAACEADGSGGQFNDGGSYSNFYCSQADDGLYYIFLTN